ncbi:MAG TPA: cytochrome c-type biogenesis protein [Burkholderiaceae bacterium]|nr:cytochrome c-type biogenesis protein [Burkholderiaceae bacterium]
MPTTLPAVPQAGLAADPVLDERVNRLASELRCLVCQNQTIADSQAELAVQLKHEVRQQLSRGASEAEVRDFMVQRYGEFVLYRPPVNPATWLLWSGPALLLLVGLVVLGLHWRARRWQGQPEPGGWEGGDAAAVDDDVVPPQEGRTP